MACTAEFDRAGRLPGIRLSGGITDPLDWTLCVELEGRSVLRLSGVPPPPVQPPPDFTLPELAASLAEA